MGMTVRKSINFVPGKKLQVLGSGAGLRVKRATPQEGAGGGGLPTLPAVSGLMNWLLADFGVVYSGPTITTWQDQSGNGRDWTTSPSNNFAVVPNSQNGLPVMDNPPFQTTSWMSTPAFLADGDSAELFVVLKSFNDFGSGWSNFNNTGSSTSA